LTNSACLNLLATITPESSESDVEHKVIVPLLHLLGYSNEDWQTQVGIGSSKIDFLISFKATQGYSSAYLVIETKSPKKKLEQSIWQISDYMRQTEAVLGLLTNGYTFCLLCNHQGKISKLAEYSQSDLSLSLNLENHLFYKVLSKKACLIFSKELRRSQLSIKTRFLSIISKALLGEDKARLLIGEENFEPETGRDLSKNLIQSKTSEKAMIITVFNNKGGVGKTTTTINLAAALSKLGKRVLLIDVDAQANLTLGLGIDPLDDVEKQGKKDIGHLLTDPRVSLEEVIIKKRWDDVKLDIVPSHIRLSHMESTLMMTPDIDRVLAKKTKKYVDEYDYILIDPPPSFGKANTIALMASSGVLIPTQLSSYPIRALEFVVGRAIAVDELKEGTLPILGIAVSMHNRTATKVSLEMIEQLKDILQEVPGAAGVEIYPQSTWIPNLSIISTTPNKGYPICFAEFDEDLDRREKEAAQDAFYSYLNLAKHLISTTNKGD